MGFRGFRFGDRRVDQPVTRGTAAPQVPQRVDRRRIALRLILGDQPLNDAGQVFRHAFQHAMHLRQLDVGRGMPHHPGQLLVAAEGGKSRQQRLELPPHQQLVGRDA